MGVVDSTPRTRHLRPRLLPEAPPEAPQVPRASLRHLRHLRQARVLPPGGMPRPRAAQAAPAGLQRERRDDPRHRRRPRQPQARYPVADAELRVQGQDPEGLRPRDQTLHGQGPRARPQAPARLLQQGPVPGPHGRSLEPPRANRSEGGAQQSLRGQRALPVGHHLVRPVRPPGRLLRPRPHAQAEDGAVHRHQGHRGAHVRDTRAGRRRRPGVPGRREHRGLPQARGSQVPRQAPDHLLRAPQVR